MDGFWLIDGWILFGTNERLIDWSIDRCQHKMKMKMDQIGKRRMAVERSRRTKLRSMTRTTPNQEPLNTRFISSSGFLLPTNTRHAGSSSPNGSQTENASRNSALLFGLCPGFQEHFPLPTFHSPHNQKPKRFPSSCSCFYVQALSHHRKRNTEPVTV